ncbi:MAG: hypothetical protein Q8O13_00255 [Candidatus Omnitrophota bacterium]|nr:hypothetical protein [Candidatus Omnitrophota bacterium]
MKSARHKELQEIISGCYRRAGWISVIEHYINGKKIDVLAQNIKTKYIIANEIELTSRHCIENIRLDLRAGCNEVAVICENSETLEAIRQKTKTNLDRNMFGKVKFRLISEFIPQLNSRNNTK